MAAFDFPSSPSVNQTYTANGVTWKWNGTMWMRITGAGYLEKIEEGNSKVEVDDSGSGNITATTDGTERLRITSDGKMGLGTQTPGQTLSISGTSAGLGIYNTGNNHGNVYFYKDGTAKGWLKYRGNDDRLVIGNVTDAINVLSSGNLGIGGLTNPGALLSIPAGESNTPRLAIESAVDDNDFTITQYEDGNGTYTMLGQNVKLNSSGNNTILDSGHRTAGILLDARNNGAITFLTGAANAVGENVKITSAGNLGIGDASPTKPLTVGTTTPVILLDDQSSRTLEIRGPSTTHVASILTTSGHALLLGTSNTERLRIDASGRLLLGLNSSIGGNAIFQVQGSGNKKAQFHQPDGGNCHIQFTNTTTGTSTNNGIEVGMGGDEQAQIWNYYNSFFRIGTNNTERLRITSDGKMGLGETTPLGKLHVKTSDSGASVGASADEFVIESSANTGMSILSGTSGQGLINFADSGDVNIGSILYDHSDNSLRVKTADSERLRITSDGDLESGNITISSYCNTHSPDNYSVFLADNHANTFFGQNLKLDYNSANNSGNHQLRVTNQHGTIGGAGMLIGGNGSSYVNELNFYTVAANQPANTRVDDTNKRLTIRSNGDITIRGTNSQYVECASFEQTQAGKNTIVANNQGMVQFNTFSNTNSTIISHSSSTNPSRITFPVAGAVHFSMYQDIITAGSTGYTQVRLYKNGSIIKYSLITLTNGQWDTIMMNHVVEVAANDYLEVYYTGGTIQSMDYNNWCSYNFVFYPINTNRG